MAADVPQSRDGAGVDTEGEHHAVSVGKLVVIIALHGEGKVGDEHLHQYESPSPKRPTKWDGWPLRNRIPRTCKVMPTTDYKKQPMTQSQRTGPGGL